MNDSYKRLIFRLGFYCLCVIAAAWVCVLPFAPAGEPVTGGGGEPEGLAQTSNAGPYGTGANFAANGAGMILGLLVIVAAVFAAALAVRYSAGRPRGQAALVATMPLLPVVAVVCALVIFLVGGNQYLTPIASFVVALVFWSLAAESCSGFLTVEHCNETSSGELRYRDTQLGVRLQQAKEIVHSSAAGGAGGGGSANQQAAPAKAAYEEALEQNTVVKKELSDEETGNEKGSLGWVLATGYLNLWKRLHRAEEALIEVLPEQTVIAGALEDELRLIGSQIDSRDELLAKLRHAVVALDPCATDFLKLSADEHKAMQSLQGDPCLAQRTTMARPILRMVRRAINEYRDDRYEGLVMSRNRTWGTTIFTGLTAFMLLAIAIMRGASRPAIVAGAAFYFVGATIGLLGRLRSQSEEEGDVPDYGLSTARLYSTPVICGLAALGGVLLVATLPFAANAFLPGQAANVQTNAVRSTTQAAPGMTNRPNSKLAAPTDVPSATNPAVTPRNPTSDKPPLPAESENKPNLPPPLTDIFDLRKNLLGVLVAAVFGLTPGLLFNRLQQQAEKYKSEIKTSEASKGGR